MLRVTVAALLLLAASPALATSLYEDAVLARSPTGYWRLADPSGTVATARVGSNGTYVGSPALGQAGALANESNAAVAFAAGTSVDLGDASYLGGNAADWTISAWIQTTTTAQGYVYAEGQDFAQNNLIGLEINHAGTATNKIHLFVRNAAGTIVVVDSSASVNDGLWHFVAGTKSGNTYSLFVDGVASGTPLTSALGSFGVTEAAIGTLSRDNPDTQLAFFGGTIDEVALYGSALSGAQLLAQYQAASAAVPEPATWLLAGIAVGAGYGRGQRRR